MVDAVRLRLTCDALVDCGCQERCCFGGGATAAVGWDGVQASGGRSARLMDRESLGVTHLRMYVTPRDRATVVCGTAVRWDAPRRPAWRTGRSLWGGPEDAATAPSRLACEQQTVRSMQMLRLESVSAVWR